MAYVAGRTKEGRIIYDTAVISGKDGLYIERLHQRDEDISEITSYILLRPLLMIVPVRK